MKWQIFIGHAVYFASAFFTALIILALKYLRKRQQRRSPLHGKQIGHVPGQQLLDRIDRANEGVGLGVDAMILAMPLLFLVWATQRIDWAQVRFGLIESMRRV